VDALADAVSDTVLVLLANEADGRAVPTKLSIAVSELIALNVPMAEATEESVEETAGETEEEG
jgi:hypothetical protein